MSVGFLICHRILDARSTGSEMYLIQIERNASMAGVLSFAIA